MDDNKMADAPNPSLEQRVAILEQTMKTIQEYIAAERASKEEFRKLAIRATWGLVTIVAGQFVTVWIPSIIQHVQWIQGHP